MSDFKQITPVEIEKNVINLIKNDWFLITADFDGKCNTMTASWGTFGHLWNKPVMTVYVRPERYTYDFIEKADLFSACFLKDGYRSTLNYCGANSGRDGNKIEACGLTPVTLDGVTCFEQAKLSVILRKLYSMNLERDCFHDSGIPHTFYDNEGIHKLYVGEIIKVYENND